jgi:N4-gp56 family major capsid protein
MADALMGVTETSAAALANISSMAQMYLQQESKLLPTVSNFSNLAVPGASSIKLPRSGGFIVGDKSENTSVSSQVITYAADTISLNQHRVVQFLLEDIANQQSMVNVVQDALLKASKDLAFDIDSKIKATFDSASTSTPDHVIQYNDTANEDIELVDILAMRKLLIDQNIDPRECFLGVGSAQEKNMLAIDNFISAEKYGSNEPILNGEIGKVYGMRVIVSNVFSGTDSYAWHPTASGFAMQQEVRVQREYDLAELSWRYSLDYIGGFSVLDSGKRVVKIEETA